MITYLDGKLVEKMPTRVVIDIHGVGYEVLIPVSTFEQLADTGSQIKLFTYHHVREDVAQLFGFFSTREKWMFEKLLSVSGVGPKLALTILSGCNVDDLGRLIANNDVDRLTKLPGVGKKTAQRICLELRDKLGHDLASTSTIPTGIDAGATGVLEEGILALTSLGIGRGDAEKNLMKILAAEPDLSVDELIRKSLRKS